MRQAMLGALMGAGIVMFAWGWGSGSVAISAGPVNPATSGDAALIALPSAAADHGQHVTVIDTRLKSMGVYHIDPASGRIKLMSVRNINWDLQMLQLNSESPLPQEIQAMLQQR